MMSTLKRRSSNGLAARSAAISMHCLVRRLTVRVNQTIEQVFD